jgi:hypothetical protein
VARMTPLPERDEQFARSYSPTQRLTTHVPGQTARPSRSPRSRAAHHGVHSAALLHLRKFVAVTVLPHWPADAGGRLAPPFVCPECGAVVQAD